MTEAQTFSLLWTLGLAAVLGVPLTLAIVHSLLRGGEPPAERRSRELYLRLLEEEVYGDRCLGCRAAVEPDWLRCPVCAEALRSRCAACDATVKLHWSACPWCATAIPSAPTLDAGAAAA